MIDVAHERLAPLNLASSPSPTPHRLPKFWIIVPQGAERPQHQALYLCRRPGVRLISTVCQIPVNTDPTPGSLPPSPHHKDDSDSFYTSETRESLEAWGA
jgi:hypothetical protein